MGAIPEAIEEIGDVHQKLRANPEFDPTACAVLTSRDFFVFSRIDGTSTVRDLILMSGLGADETIGILRKLRGQGAFLVGSETPADVARAAAVAAPAGSSTPGEVLTPEEEAALAEDCALSREDRRVVLLAMRAVRAGDLYRILGAAPDADARTLKRAYFARSKKFHPDRYYGKNTGSFGPLLSELFEAATRAWNVLSDHRKRAAYDREQRGAGASQTRAEYAAELYERAARAEAQGELEQSFMLFIGAAKSDPQPRYMRRAASSGVRAGKLAEAETWARRALEQRGEDPSYWRVLADVLTAAGRLDEAAQTLEHASRIRTENDALAVEIARDLEALARRRRR